MTGATAARAQVLLNLGRTTEAIKLLRQALSHDLSHMS